MTNGSNGNGKAPCKKNHAPGPDQRVCRKCCHAICGAKTRTCKKCKGHQREHAPGKEHPRCQFDPRTCITDKLMPNGRCRMHGGATPNGLALPQTINGRYSRYLSPALLVPYGESQGLGADALQLVDEVNLLDALTAAAVIDMEAGGEPDVNAGRRAFTAMERANQSGDVGQLATSVEALRAALFEPSRRLARAEVAGLAERRRRMVDSERGARIADGEMMATQTVLFLFGTFARLCIAKVTEQTDRNYIAGEFDRIAGGRRASSVRPDSDGS